MPFSYVKHANDVELDAGDTAEEALQSGVQGLIELIVDPGTVRPAYTSKFEVEGGDFEQLFAHLMAEVLAIKDETGQYFQKFELDRFDNDGEVLRAKGTLWGEPFDPRRHDVLNQIKGVAGTSARRLDGNGIAVHCVLALES